MCGIIGITAKECVAENLLDGLKRLEYRGYDSAGIAVFNGQQIERKRAEGKLQNLSKTWYNEPIDGHIGIGHTRWATHGIANQQNAHPHMNAHVAVVHNGIIENYMELKQQILQHDAEHFESETDSEILVHLATHFLKKGLSPHDIMKELMSTLQGAFAFVMLFSAAPNQLFGARVGSPLAVGIGDDANFFGSDALSMAHLTNKIVYLEDYDWAVIEHNNYVVFDGKHQQVKRPLTQVNNAQMLIDKENYPHFMLKEIYEQPTVISDTLHSLLHRNPLAINIENIDALIAKTDHLIISACGTAYYAGFVGTYWFQEFANMPCTIDIASEFRYRPAVFPKNATGLVLSQSGETMDSIEAMKVMQAHNIPIISITNVEGSTIARKSSSVLQTKAGTEIGVASTKAFTTQLITVMILALYIGRLKKHITQMQEQQYLQEIMHIPAIVNQTLIDSEKLHHIADLLKDKKYVLYLGRGIYYPLALEGALKLKEISYINAEGYAAGEMKHGPIALIEEGLPVIALIPEDKHFMKTLSNIQEAAARGAQIIPITTQKAYDKIKELIPLTHYHIIPDSTDIQSSITISAILQLIAYYTAAKKGTDIDQPRNLAKSVTVE